MITLQRQWGFVCAVYGVLGCVEQALLPPITKNVVALFGLHLLLLVMVVVLVAHFGFGAVMLGRRSNRAYGIKLLGKTCRALPTFFVALFAAVFASVMIGHVL